MWFRRKNPFDEILKAHIDGDFSLFGAGADAPSSEAIEDFEKSMDVCLPGDFRDFSRSNLGGIYIEVKEAIWPRPKQYEVGPFWSFLYGLFVYGFAKNIPDWMDIQIQTLQFRQNTGTSYTPCLKIMGDADVYCFDKEGKTHRWDHETGQVNLQNKSFTEIFASEVAELRKRKDRKLAESKV